MTRPLAALALLFALVQPARATLVLSNERPVTSPPLESAPFDQSNARIATDGTSFLAVWVDHTLAGAGDVHAARVEPSGVAGETLAVARTSGDEDHPAIAWGGNRFLVVWSTATAVQARLVSPDGAMSPVFDIESVDRMTEPKVAFNGRVFLVVWSGPGTKFRAAIVDAEGRVTQRFDAASAAQTWPEIDLVSVRGVFQLITAVTDFNGSPNGNGYPADVGYTTIDENGAISPRFVVAPAETPVFDVRASAGSDDFLIGWSTARGIAGAQIRSVRVGPNGAGSVENFAAEMMYVQDVVAEAGGILLLYGDERTKFVRRAGAASAAPIAAPADLSTILDASSAGGQTLFVVRRLGRLGFEYGPAGGDLYVGHLGSSEYHPLAVAPHHQMSPDVAEAGDGVRLAVWCETLAGSRRLSIVAARITPFGSLETAGVDLGADVYHPAAPRVASDGNGWLVVWTDARTVYGARVTHDGAAAQSAPFVVASDVYESTEVDVAWDGTSYVVVFTRGQFLRGLRTTVRAVRVGSDGSVGASEVALSEEIANEYPSIAAGGDGSLVVWRGGPYLRGALLSRTGITTPVTFPISLAALPHPAAAWNGTEFLVACALSGASGSEIQWAMVSRTGVVRLPSSPGSIPLLPSFGPATYGFPTLALDAEGDRFILAFNSAAPDVASRTALVSVAMIDGDGVLVERPVPAAVTLVDYTRSIALSGRTLVYARKIGHLTRELAQVFTREVREEERHPRRRAVR